MNIVRSWFQTYCLLILATSGLTIIGCTSNSDVEIPDYIEEMENVTVFPLDVEPTSHISLKEEAVFGSTDEVVLGLFFPPAVDGQDRVYLGETGEYTIRVFAPDGTYLKQIGRRGQGPGEFLSPPIPQIVSDTLIVYDNMQLRVSFYSTDSHELIRTLNLNPRNQYSIEELSERYIQRIFYRSDNLFLGVFAESEIPPFYSNYDPDKKYVLKYYLIDDDGRVLPDELFELRESESLVANVNGEVKSLSYDFLSKPLVSIADDGTIYTAYSDEFLITVRSSDEGEYQRAFYHPLIKREFHREEALQLDFSHVPDGLIPLWRGVLQNVSGSDLPDYWPVLNSLYIDDENRLWVSTVAEDSEIYEWWVLHDTGEVIARFDWPRDSVIEVVKNGFVYARKIDSETGIHEIVRFRIILES